MEPHTIHVAICCPYFRVFKPIQCLMTISQHSLEKKNLNLSKHGLNKFIQHSYNWSCSTKTNHSFFISMDTFGKTKKFAHVHLSSA